MYFKQNYISVSQGDSGGGAVYKNKIYGVISFLGDPDHVCRKAAAFMDLCDPEYASWINQTIAWEKEMSTDKDFHNESSMRGNVGVVGVSQKIVNDLFNIWI